MHLRCLLRSFPLFPCAIGLVAATLQAQTSTSMTETVNKRRTIGVTSSSSSTVTAGTAVNFGYILHTAGAPAPSSDTVQFQDGGASLGSAQAVTSTSATNLLPYSQVVLSDGWTTTGTAPTVTGGAATGPDGGTSTATTIAFPSTASGTSGVAYAVAATAYASTSLTLSVWAQSSAGATLTLGLTDSPATAASGSNTCTVSAAWQRCVFTLAFPSNAGTGFAAKLSVSGQAAVSVNLWGAQVEQSTSAGPYVSTIGTARPSGAEGGAVTYSTSSLAVGTHTINVVFAGNGNFVASTSNTVSITVTQAAPTVVLAASPASPASYGTSLTFTATVSGSAGTPGGSVQLMDGATSLGTATLNGSGVATFTLSGTGALAAGAHSLTAAYAGNTSYSSANSPAVSYTVTKSSNASLAATSSRNPSVYGDSVTFSLAITTSAGVLPTGTVTISDGGTSIGTATLDGTGHATYTVNNFTAGSHSLVFTYSGDANYN